MIINWYKYIREMLPTRLRLASLVELLRVLTFQIPKIGSDFDLKLANLKYRTHLNASAIALEKLIEKELEAIVSIEELDGKPFDFLVNVHSPVDETRLKVLINQYKLAGKSFLFKLGAVAYTAEFTNYECEDIIELYTAEFTGHVCEQDGVNKITLFLGMTTGGLIQVDARSQQPVKSNITITGNVIGYDDTGAMLLVDSFSISINTGDSWGIDDTVNPSSNAEAYGISSGATVLPDSDDYFNYVLEYIE